MRKLLYISLALMLMACFMSCSRGVDKRLVLADTLMWTAPDSSLAILESINRDSLQGEENLSTKVPYTAARSPGKRDSR